MSVSHRAIGRRHGRVGITTWRLQPFRARLTNGRDNRVVGYRNNQQRRDSSPTQNANVAKDQDNSTLRITATTKPPEPGTRWIASRLSQYLNLY